MTTTETRATLQERRNHGLKKRHAQRLARGTWMPIDEWFAAYEAARDPNGHYGSVGLKVFTNRTTDRGDQ